jgi:hypothetical protein
MRSHKDVNFTALANVRIGGSIIAGTDGSSGTL